MPVVDSAAALLHEARRRAGLTQAQLGQRATVTQSVVSAYESGQRQPSLPMLLHLLRAGGHALDASRIATTSPPTAALSALSCLAACTPSDTSVGFGLPHLSDVAALDVTTSPVEGVVRITERGASPST